jgi:hypothetical protein
MSSFFGDLQSGGIQMPEAIFDQSSMLPSADKMSNYGPGFNGVPDGRINAGSTLFSDMDPYAYGKGDRLSTQTAYLANPHNIQKIVPQLLLPDCNKSDQESTFLLPHSVSDGDVAFSVRFGSSEARTAHLKGFKDFARQGAGRALDYVCNIATVNYIMRGLFTDKTQVNRAWNNYAAALGFEDSYNEIQTMITRLNALPPSSNFDSTETTKIKAHIRGRMRCMAENLVRDNFRPLGVVIGSQKQGGQHEVANSTVTWPVAYIVTISIDGRNENLCNYWRHMHVSSGSDLDFVVQLKARSNYALNYAKQVTHKHFGHFTPCQWTPEGEYPQLCPSVNGKVRESKTGNPSPQDKIITGHWHFSMSQIMQQKITEEELFSDVTSFHVGALIQSTVSIVWVRKRCPDEIYAVQGGTIPFNKDSVMAHFHQKFAGVNPRAIQVHSVPKPQYLNTVINPRSQVIQGRIALIVKSPYAKNPAEPLPSVQVNMTGSQAHVPMQAMSIAKLSCRKMTDHERVENGMVPLFTPQKMQRTNTGANVVSMPVIVRSTQDASGPTLNKIDVTKTNQASPTTVLPVTSTAAANTVLPVTSTATANTALPATSTATANTGDKSKAPPKSARKTAVGKQPCSALSEL